MTKERSQRSDHSSSRQPVATASSVSENSSTNVKARIESNAALFRQIRQIFSTGNTETDNRDFARCEGDNPMLEQLARLRRSLTSERDGD